MRKFIALAVIPLVFVLASCGDKNEPKPKPADVAAQTENKVEAAASTAPEPENLSGKWSTSEKDGPSFEAEVTANHITINYTDPEQPDYSALYWDGTFETPDNGVVQSVGNTEEMESALLASQDASKAFSYKDDKLSFKFSAMGVSQVIHLRRAD